jgi:bifunctional UDP-N-acetylglucosamine pyrophosphorylase / glucosamine-1-phosphate N-acetyltransferase
MSQTSAIILAAGKSTRMKSTTCKVLHEVCGLPMLAHVLDACVGACVDKLVVVVGHDKDAVIETFSSQYDDIEWVEQKEQKGTGHAALVCEDVLKHADGQTIVMAGDMPLIRADMLSQLLAENTRTGDAVTLASSVFDDPAGYGRIERDDAGRLMGIVEQIDCNESQAAIREVNISYYCFDNARLFNTLHKITPDNAKREYYITDAVHILLRDGFGADALPIVEPDDAMGVNSRADLALVNAAMQLRIQREWMDNGVTVISPSNTWINAGCSIGAGTVIQPFSFIGAGAQIGEYSHIGPGAVIGQNEDVPPRSHIGPATVQGVVS